MKVARTVWSRGKGRDNIRALPIAIINRGLKGVNIEDKQDYKKIKEKYGNNRNL